MKLQNYDPIPLEVLAKAAGVSVDEAREFINSEFGSYEEYVAACRQRKPIEKTIGRLVAEAN